MDRKISRAFLRLLPEALRHSIMRKNVRVDPNWPSSSLVIKIAETEEELASAYKLLHDSYVKSGFMDPDPSGMRVLPQHILPQTTTIVAKWDSKVIGTLSLIRDNPFGLPLEKIFNVDEHRKHGKRLAEVSSLAMDPNYRGQINIALFPLFRFVYQYARNSFGIHEFIIAVNPSMVDLYLGFMCFEKLNVKSKSYDFVKGATAVGLYLNFEIVDEIWKKNFNHRPISSNLHHYWSTLPTDPKNQMPKRDYHSASDPILTPLLLSQFFLEKAQLSKKLSIKEIQFLMEVYPYPDFIKILKPLYDSMSRKNIRFETQMKAQWVDDSLIGEVLNVSREGLLVRTPNLIMIQGQQSYIRVWLNNTTSTQLKVEVYRSKDFSLLGLKIVETTNEWLNMIEVIECEYQHAESYIKKAA